MNPKTLSIDTFDYSLPDGRIAYYPLAQRDASKLLVWKDGEISESHFYDLDKLFPSNSLLVINDTKVIRARLFFENAQGTRIEIFCLDPLEPASPERALAQRGSGLWKCYIGNLRRWKDDRITCNVDIDGQRLTLQAERIAQIEDAYSVRFTWNSEHTMAHIFEASGHIPLPPYIKRADENEDQERYQAIFAQQDGSVAAPTASLHFTPALMDRLKDSAIGSCRLTLHVGAGTFKPVNSHTMIDHHMHQERLIIEQSSLLTLCCALEKNQRIIPIGTTALRSLESLYYFGLRLSHNREAFSTAIDQWEPYDTVDDITPLAALQAILHYMDQQNLSRIETATGIFIAPGFKFHYTEGLVTNFHQPKSTLLVLIAAIMGNDWRQFYEYALQHDFRFLSYGDACLIWPKNPVPTRDARPL